MTDWFVHVKSTDALGQVCGHSFTVEAEDAQAAESEAVRQIREDWPDAVSVSIGRIGGKPEVYPLGSKS